MSSSKKKSVRFLKGEKFMYFIVVLLLVAIPTFNVFTSGILSETNTKLARLENKIATQDVSNQSLSMQIDELASLDNIQNIAQEYGLSYNNGSIKIISEE